MLPSIYVVILDPSKSNSRVVPICIDSATTIMMKFVCNTTEGSLIWETSSTASNYLFDQNLGRQSPKSLGVFTLYRDGVAVNMATTFASAVNSTAVLTDPVQLSHDGVTLKCSEYTDLTKYSKVVLSVLQGKS